jgi:carbamoyltransferase
MYILGISAFYHDSAASLLKDGKIVYAAQEERFTRTKHDSSFPINSIRECLNSCKISLDEIEYIGFYEKPFRKFFRLLKTFTKNAPFGFESFDIAMMEWLTNKIFLKKNIINELYNLQKLLNKKCYLDKKKINKKILFCEHHESHAASCFYPSPFNDSAILTIDGVGEETTTSIAYGKNNEISLLKEIHFPNSIGLLYSAFTYYLGFKVNSGEYKVMGLAPYGKPKYKDLILNSLINVKNDGSFKLNMKFFDFHYGFKMINSNFIKLFGREKRNPETKLDEFHMDIASSIQKAIEEIVLKLCKSAKELTKSENLVLAGGVALNCVANGKILEEKIFRNIWIQPASGDAGGSLGVALSIYYKHLSNERIIKNNEDSMYGSYLGPKFENKEVENFLNKIDAKYHYMETDNIIKETAKLITEGKIIGWHSGKMEFGPRSLGARSILADPRDINMQTKLNLKIKYRESFRPFAPAVIKEKANKYFNLGNYNSPYMLLVSQVKNTNHHEANINHSNIIETLNQKRSDIPAVTHIDYSARIQTVDKKTNPNFYNLILEFEKLSGIPILINTSFNVRGEPIVCSPEDSYKCFMRTDMDILIIENYLLFKNEQPEFSEKINWKEKFKLD